MRLFPGGIVIVDKNILLIVFRMRIAVFPLRGKFGVTMGGISLNELGVAEFVGEVGGRRYAALFVRIDSKEH